MDRETSLTQVGEEDLRVVENELASSPAPASLRALAEKLAYHKTAGQRTQAVKKYDPRCRYEVGDQILKEYDESLTVSSKTAEHFEGSVVLTVIGKTADPAFGCEILEVDYSGGGTFRRYIDYMKKNNAQAFLPSNVEGENLEPEAVSEADDPRTSELPITDRDLKALEKNLRTALLKSPDFFAWNDLWQLSRNQAPIPDEKVKEAEARILETGLPASTEELVEKLFGLEPSSSLFDIHALSLNHVLDKKHKKEFLFLSLVGWGRWHLKKLLNALPLNLPLNAPPARVPSLEKGILLESSASSSFPLKVYLTWREILSGGIRVPRSLHKELKHSREYVLTEAEEGRSYPVYFFPNLSCFLGLADYYAANNIPQGTSLTLERKDPTRFEFWVKKSKKKLAVPRLAYDAENDTFSDTGEDVFTFALPNKSIFIEREVLSRLLTFDPRPTDLDLHDLLLLVFNNFSPLPGSSSQHFLRAFHLADILRRTSQEDVEAVLLSSGQFQKSEKKKGVFLYKSEEEAGAEEEEREKKERKPAARADAEPVWEAGEDEGQGDELPIGMIAEDFGAEEEEAEEEVLRVVEAEPAPVPKARGARPPVRPAAAPPPEKPAAAERTAKKEKPAKKKKPKLEAERMPRLRKSERKVIEEKIELEESEMEALTAVKAAESEAADEMAVLRAEPGAEAAEAAETPAEAPAADEAKKAPAFGGLFAEKLKVALKKKPDDKDKDQVKDKVKKKKT
ncbi:MAG: hypothetical protein JW747_01545 [Candidatus Aminicenantes bacterium]|nr:hypothetical protein [Candidatus Aminicenantes bacterium]